MQVYALGLGHGIKVITAADQQKSTTEERAVSHTSPIGGMLVSEWRARQVPSEGNQPTKQRPNSQGPYHFGRWGFYFQPTTTSSHC